jgi:septal ring factor EnvC (AmiA/AmiB activator)
MIFNRLTHWQRLSLIFALIAMVLIFFLIRKKPVKTENGDFLDERSVSILNQKLKIQSELNAIYIERLTQLQKRIDSLNTEIQNSDKKIEAIEKQRKHEKTVQMVYTATLEDQL